MAIDRLRDALEALGPPVTPLELAEMLWLAERLPPGEDAEGRGEGRGERRDARGPFGLRGTAGALDSALARSADFASCPVAPDGSGADDGHDGGDDDGHDDTDSGAPRAALHVPRGGPHPGSDADEVLVPAPQALRHELAIQRALRPLKQRVPDRHRRTLDERATAERASRHPRPRPWAPVMVPATDRLLSLALVADTGPAMTVWRPLVRELREAMQRTGAFRDVRVWQLTDLGGRVGVRSSPGGPARDPAALVDATGRQVTLVLSDCSGPHWWAGHAAPALHLWARRGPTAILQPLPERLWRRTAAPAVPGRAIASRAGAPNTVLRFTPHDGRVRLPAADALPVPVLELAPEWLADWAGLVTASGDHRRDTAVTYVSCAPAPPGRPLTAEGDLPITERVLRFQAAASPTAADLAAHVALSVPALPVMRLIQQRVTPGSRPSDLAEILLSGLLEPVDAERGLYDFVPGARTALLETLPRPESLAVADLLGRLGEEIEARAGSASRAFRAVVEVAQGTGSRGLGPAAQPFALVSEEALGLLRGRAIRVAKRPVEEPRDGAVPGVPAGGVEVPWPPSEFPAINEFVASGEFRPVGSVTSPPGLTNVPEPARFIGRDSERRRLDLELLPMDSPHSPRRAIVVHGPAGVGKSALAAVWARGVAAGDLPGPVWWVTAESRASIADGLSGLTRALQPSAPDAFAGGGGAEWAVRWLFGHWGWTLVLDGVGDPADVSDLLPRLGTGGAVLITSRAADGWEGIAEPVELRVPELDEAVALLNEYAGRAVPGADVLCEELGRLPLAVVNAGMYLGGTTGSADRYRTEPAMLEVGEDLSGEDGIRARLRAVAADTVAGRILLVLAWYGPEPVPRDLLPPAASGRDGLHALDFLAARELIQLSSDAVVLPVLVAAEARTPDDDHRVRSPRMIDDARLTAALCLRNALPQEVEDPRTWPRWRQLLPHIDALLEHGRSVDDNRHFVSLLTRSARFLLSQGESEKAVAFLWRAVRDRERMSGPQAPKTLAVAAQLAGAYRANGTTIRAIRQYENVLDALRAKGRGEEDPDVLELRAELAVTHHLSGEPDHAVSELREVCHIAGRVLGDDHPKTLTMRARLADAHLAAGEPGAAVALYEQTAAACRRIYGDDAPHTLAVRTELAFAHGAAGDMPHATELLEQVALDCRRLHGLDHPRTFTALSDLASWYARADMTGHAVELYDEVLARGTALFGELHPYTLAVRQSLAEAWLSHGDAARAVPLLEHVLSVREPALGEDHPDTLLTVDSLAAAYGAGGARHKQAALYERALTARLRVLTENDPETLKSYDRLANAVDAGDGREIALRSKAHHGRVRTLGEDHPETLDALDRLAYARLEAGDTAEALSLLRHSLDLRRATGRPADSAALRVLGTLAQIHLSDGDPSRAAAVYAEAYEYARTVLGEGPAADVLLERALAHLKSVLGPRHREVRALKKRSARPR
ncbi:SAV_2336 N-terminal domain-related protein [Streptomyces sp. 135]|uniref:SAV_2336 N-terminal domain-related protein n=1 Tax=Streptomyces sp. 135 TaxID=2838850 RepID=UPI001CBB7656|nr:SAV_2336 N-terminal domain-related protein [Streptomyces sp. 135]